MYVYNAGGGVDYDSGPFTITIPAGEIFAVFNVSLNDDSMIEGNENFSLSIDPSSLPGSIDQATINIVDDDCKYLFIDSFVVLYMHMATVHSFLWSKQ